MIPKNDIFNVLSKMNFDKIIFSRPKDWILNSSRSLIVPLSVLKLLETLKFPSYFSLKDIIQAAYTIANNGDLTIFKGLKYTCAGQGLNGIVTRVMCQGDDEDDYYLQTSQWRSSSFRFKGSYIPDFVQLATEYMISFIISDIKKEYKKWLLIKHMSNDIDIDAQIEIAKFLILVLCQS